MSDAWVDLAYSVYGSSVANMASTALSMSFFGDTLSTYLLSNASSTISNWAAASRASRPSVFIESPTGPTATKTLRAIPARVPRANAPASAGRLILFLYVSKDSWKVFFFGVGFLPKLEKSKACGV